MPSARWDGHMRVPTILAMLLLLAVSLAGCSKGGSGDEGPKGDDDGGDGPVDPGDGGDGNETPNSPPTASITASITDGTAPLSVNFTLDASDQDNDTLSWTLDADGDGTPDQEGTNATFPIVANFTYADAGNFTANLTVTDGTDSTSRELAVSVGGAVANINAFIGTVTTQCNRTCENLGANLCDSFRDGEQ